MLDSDKTGWVVLTQNNCMFCSKAIRALNDAGVTAPHLILIDLAPEFKGFLREQGLLTVPQVYHQGARIGGFEDLEDYLAHLLADYRYAQEAGE
jgi:glutaredoxin